MLYRKQLLAARAILEITQAELAELSGVAAVTIGKLEVSDEAFNKAASDTIRKMRQALIVKGIKFISPTDETQGIAGIGVRYHPSGHQQ